MDKNTTILDPLLNFRRYSFNKIFLEKFYLTSNYHIKTN
jgi:hypothetical protein